MGNVSCTLDDCAACVGNAVWAFVSIDSLIVIAILLVSIYYNYLLFFSDTYSTSLNSSSNSLKPKFKYLILLCNIFFIIATGLTPYNDYEAGTCDYSDFSIFFWQLSYFMQIGNATLVIIFIQRLHDSVKDSIFELPNYVKIITTIMAFIQIGCSIFLPLEWEMYFGPVWQQTLWSVIYYTERSIYVCVTLILLYLFSNKMRSIVNVMKATSVSDKVFGNKRNEARATKYANAVAKQTAIVCTALATTVISILLWVCNDTTHSIAVYHIALWGSSIDMLVNTMCLHAMFKHGNSIYKRFGCQICANRLLKIQCSEFCNNSCNHSCNKKKDVSDTPKVSMVEHRGIREHAASNSGSLVVPPS